MPGKAEPLAAELYDKIARAAIENSNLRRAVKAIKALGENGLTSGATGGGAHWREALERIVEIAKRH